MIQICQPCHVAIQNKIIPHSHNPKQKNHRTQGDTKYHRTKDGKNHTKDGKNHLIRSQSDSGQMSLSLTVNI